jgi:hypothetical protein
MTVGAVLSIIGSFAPWISSLGISANSWDLRDLVLGLGFSDNDAFDIAVTLWAVVPILLLAAVGAAWWGRALTGAILGTVGALYLGTVAVAVLRAPDIELYTVEWGVSMTIVGGLVVIAAAVQQVWLGIGDRTHRTE